MEWMMRNLHEYLMIGSISFFFGAAGFAIAPAHAEWVPPNVLAAQKKMVAIAKEDDELGCKKPKAITHKSFVTADGNDNDIYILDTGSMSCAGFNGSGGNWTQIWIDGEANFVKLYDGYARGVTLAKGKVIIELHGTACGDGYFGATPCEDRITWGNDYKVERFVQETNGKWRRVSIERPKGPLPTE